jgi:hypothetical protein
MRRLAALPLAALLAGAGVSRSGGEGHPLRDRADLSFSPIPLGTMRPPPSLGVRELREDGCHESRDCDWADARGVRHYFWEGDELVVKSVRARDVGGRAIAALGIGRARARAEVIANVRAFVPESEIACEPEATMPEPGDPAAPATNCGGTLDEGWFRIWFDAADNLVEVRLDARHYV